MAQAIDVPILEIPSIQKAMTIDELSSMWNVFSKCKNSIENGRRLENLSWRLWYRESSLHSSSVSTCSTFNSSINENQSSATLIIENKEKEEIPIQQSQPQRKCKFFVDNSDSEDSEDEDNDDDDEEEEEIEEEIDDDDEMWSTFESIKENKGYFEKAYQKKITLSSISTISTMTTATTLDEDDKELAFSIPSNSFHYNKHCISKLSSSIIQQQQQQQPISLLSKLFKQENQQQKQQINNDIPPELPPTLQSCCDWEKSQNMLIPCKLGQSPILPDENIIW